MRIRFPTLAVSCVLSTAALAASEVVGRWDLTVQPGNYPSWVGVYKEDSTYKVHFLGAAGGVDRNVQGVEVRGDTLTFQAHGRKWVGTVNGDTMTGTATDDKGKEFTFVGKRFVPPIDVSGIWKVHIEAQRGRDPVLSLIQKNGQIVGTWKSGDETISLENIKLDAGVLSFVVPDEKRRSERTIRAEATVKGDVLEGTAVVRGYKRKLHAQREREWDEPIELFNGRNLDGWKPLGEGKNFHWTVIDSIMTNTVSGDNIVSERKFKDFRIHVEFRVPRGGNSGVYLRGRYEIQVEDSYGKKPHGGMCGAMYSRLLPSENASRPAGEWQTFDATLIGQYITLIHNGVKVIDNQEIEGITGGAIDSHEYEPGPIYLQGDHGPIEYRRITVYPARPPRVAIEP